MRRMADDSSGSWFSSLPLPGILAVLSAVAGTLLVQYQPLTPRRPADSGQGTMANLNERKIDATLLEDPFSAINRVTLVSPPVPGEEPQSSEQQASKSGASPSGLYTRRMAWLPSALKDEVKKVVGGCPEDPQGGKTHRHEVLVIPVVVRPFSDVATSEIRARMRQAVMCALYSSGYSADNRRINCLRLPRWNPDGPQDGKSGGLVDVPFEWADPTDLADPHINSTTDPAVTDTRYAKVLVLWLRNDLIGTQGIVRLREFCDAILPQGETRGPTGKTPNLAEDHIIVRMLGPSSTETLGNLVKDATLNKKAQDDADKWQHSLGRMAVPVCGRWPGMVALVSPRATGSALAVLTSGFGADDFRALDDAANRDKKAPLPGDYLATLLTGQQPSGAPKRTGDPPLFMRTTTTDEVVAEALTRELLRRLHRRIPWLERHWAPLSEADRLLSDKSHLVLISEFDSPYGRGLPPLFTGSPEIEEHTPWLHTFSYARGLDGSVHQPAGGKGEGDGKKPGERTKEEYRPDEVPAGLNQIDSLRRLAVQIEELDNRLQKEENGGEVVAVGILGSDVYDKLLILRALRPRLKKTIFFTNNLDAWFWQKDELPNTRNLVVASPYGVVLNEAFQRGVTPFRDSYQTGDFAGALAALNVISPDVLSGSASYDAVRLFEIGKDGPYDLSLETAAVAKPAPLHPPRADHRSWWKNPQREPFRWPIMLLFPFVIGLATLMAFIDMTGAKPSAESTNAAVAQPQRADEKKAAVVQNGGTQADVRRSLLKFGGRFGVSVLRSTPIWIALGFPCFAFGLYKLWRIWRIEGEPYEWWSGLSAWPSEVLRLLAASLAAHFVIRTALDLRDINERMEKKFDLQPEPPAGRTAAATGETRLQRIKRALWISEGVPDVQQVWWDFKSRGRIIWRAARSLPLVLLLAVLNWVLISVMDSDHATNVRGLPMMRFDWWCDFLSHLSLIAITAFVADALWLNRSLVMRIGEEGCKWPAAYLGKFKGRPVHRDLLGAYLDLRFTAARTAEAGRVTFYPFYLMGLLIIARLDGFDRWSWPPSLACSYLGFTAIVMTIALLVRHEAETLREKALLALDRHIDAGTAGSEVGVKAHRAEIAGLRAGAFAPLSAQPAVRVVFWALGTAGAGGLWQFFSRFVS